MPKVVVSHSKGLVQESGTGVSFTPDATLTSGVHLYQEVVDFGGVTLTNTDDGVVKYLSKKLPTNSVVLWASAELIEKSNLAAVDLSLAISANDDKASGADLASETDLVTGIGADTSDTVGEVNALADPVSVGSKRSVALINAGTGNTQQESTSGKVLVSLMVAGSSAPA